MKNIIMIDRDGVINQDSHGYIKHANEWHPLPGSLEGIAQLHQAGFSIIIITNQSGIGRGLYTEEDLKKIHEKMLAAIQDAGGAIEKIYYCAHAPEENCLCRKPAPGMFHQLENDFNVTLNPQEHFYIGDKISDVRAARNANCQPILVRTGYGLNTLQEHPGLEDDIQVYDDLKVAVVAIIHSKKQ